MYSDDVVERLNESVSHLKYVEGLKTQKNIADKMGYNVSNLSQALKGNDRYLNGSFFNKFGKIFKHLDVDWILTGSGSMLKGKSYDTNNTPKMINESQGTYHLRKVSDDVLSEDEVLKVIQALYLNEDQMMEYAMFAEWVGRKIELGRSMAIDEIEGKG